MGEWILYIFVFMISLGIGTSFGLWQESLSAGAFMVTLVFMCMLTMGRKK